MTRLSQWQEWILPLGLIASILFILVPLPTGMMDVLLAANVTIAVIILLTTISVRTPLEFSIFPSLLLATTLARLVLNVASTRLILTRAQTHGTDAAGGVIESFGNFVTGDRIIVGLIIFIILIVIQFLVITKGTTRISEVTARFVLDAMPGRQMAIDADLNSGFIDQAEAGRRRQEIARQADFFGSMDGATKFVRGDAIAGIVITLTNIVGGLIIGVFQAGMGIGEAAQLFTKLTIGDGLVSQLPAFLIALAAGLLVTRSTESTNLPGQFLQQLFSRPQALLITAGFLGVLVFTQLPAIPLLSLAVGCTGLATILMRRTAESESESETETAKAPTATPTASSEPPLEDYLHVDPLELEIGIGLIRLADPKRGGDLLPQIMQLRRDLASEQGMVMPKVLIRDNMQLSSNQYRIRLATNPIASGQLEPTRLLALFHQQPADSLPGKLMVDPCSGRPGLWIEPALRDRPEVLQGTLLEPVEVICNHLQHVVRQHAHELLTRDATSLLINQLKKSAPTVVEELIPGLLSLGQVQQVLQRLLQEQVPIRQLLVILESLADRATHTKDLTLLTEHVRCRLARTICEQHRTTDGRMHVLTMDPDLEDHIASTIGHDDRGITLRMSESSVQRLCELIRQQIDLLPTAERAPLVLVNSRIRPALKLLTSAQLPQLQVLSYDEITRETQVESVSMISGPLQRPSMAYAS